MAVDDWDGEVVLYGSWLYDGTVPVAVEIVVFDRDYYNDRMIFGDESDPLRPAYNPEKRFYYVNFNGSTSNREPFGSVQSVIDWAQSMNYGIEWRDKAPVKPRRPADDPAFAFPPIGGKAEGRLDG